MNNAEEGIAFALGADAASAVLRPFERLTTIPDRWRDSLLLVQHGELRLTCTSGQSGVFGRGSLLCLDGLTLDSISAEADGAIVLARRRPSEVNCGRVEPISKGQP